MRTSTVKHCALLSLAFTLLGLTASAAASVEAADYVHPQQRVAMDGTRRLNLFCIGHGTPTVLLDAGSGGSTLDWRMVQGSIASLTKTCAYDRAGYGFSDPANRPSDARNAVDDLHHLITAAKLGRPFIIVGHSNGGLYATLYAETYPDDVAGMVLVDPGFAGQQNYDTYGLPPGRAAALKAWTAGLVTKAASCLQRAKAGFLSNDAPQNHDCLDDPPNRDASIHQAVNRQYASVAYEQTNLSEFQNSFAATAGITTDDREMPSPLRPLGTMPLIVLTASRHPAPVEGFTPQDQALFYDIWKQAHDRLAALSKTGKNIVIVESGHFIQNDKPGAVVEAVGKVLQDVRYMKSEVARHR